MLKSAYLTTFGSEIEQIAAKILLDDSIPCLYTASPNCVKIANLSKVEKHCRKLFDLMQGIICRPGEYSPKSILKGLELVSYLLVHGSDYCVEYTYSELQLQIEFMQEYNSAVILNERNILYKIKGGSSDEGEPVRDIAEELTTLLKSNTQTSLLKLRDLNLLKDKTSTLNGSTQLQLSSDDLLIGFGGFDSARSAALPKKENKMTSGGFGSGLGGKKKGDQVVVGAQFTLEHMLADQRNRPTKYYDDEQKMKEIADENKNMMDLLSQTSGTQSNATIESSKVTQVTNDLLDFNHTEPSRDNFGSTNLLHGIRSSNTQANTNFYSDQDKESEKTMEDLLNVFTVSATISSDNLNAAPPAAPPPPPPGPPPPYPPPMSPAHLDPFEGL